VAVASAAALSVADSVPAQFTGFTNRRLVAMAGATSAQIPQVVAAAVLRALGEASAASNLANAFFRSVTTLARSDRVGPAFPSKP